MTNDSPLFIGCNRIILSQVASTNGYAMALATDTLVPEGTLITATEQTEGRGQRGRIWHSQPGANLTLSYVLRPAFLAATSQFDLIRCVALAVHGCVLSFLTDEQKPLLKVKWPNDVLFDGKKLAGILMEAALRGDCMSHAVCGIGLNVNQRAFDGLPNATSLAIITGGDLHTDQVLHQLNVHLEANYIKLRAGRVAELRIAFDAQLYGRKEPMHVVLRGVPSQIVPLNTHPDGRMVVQLPDGSTTRLMHHELEWVLGDRYSA